MGRGAYRWGYRERQSLYGNRSAWHAECFGHRICRLRALRDRRTATCRDRSQKTSNEEEGRKQAELYADCLMKKYHCPRPVIYYTNGFKIKIIDGLGLSAT